MRQRKTVTHWSQEKVIKKKFPKYHEQWADRFWKEKWPVIKTGSWDAIVADIRKIREIAEGGQT